MKYYLPYRSSDVTKKYTMRLLCVNWTRSKLSDMNKILTRKSLYAFSISTILEELWDWKLLKNKDNLWTILRLFIFTNTL